MEMVVAKYLMGKFALICKRSRRKSKESDWRGKIFTSNKYLGMNCGMGEFWTTHHITVGDKMPSPNHSYYPQVWPKITSVLIKRNARSWHVIEKACSWIVKQSRNLTKDRAERSPSLKMLRLPWNQHRTFFCWEHWQKQLVYSIHPFVTTAFQMKTGKSCHPWKATLLNNVHLRFSRRWLWRMASSGMLRRVVPVITNVSEELSASIIRVTRIGC
jgi:hypothetical protein